MCYYFVSFYIHNFFKLFILYKYMKLFCFEYCLKSLYQRTCQKTRMFVTDIRKTKSHVMVNEKSLSILKVCMRENK